MPLTDTRIKNLKPKNTKPGRYGVADSHGLTLFVYDKGTKTWIHRFRYKGKAQTMTLGHYPALSLLNARQERDDNLLLLSQGVNPKEYKSKDLDSGVTFLDVFNKWHTHKSDEWSDNHALRTKQRADRHLIPFVGNRLIESIDTRIIIDTLLEIQKKGRIDTLSKVKGIVNGVFRYAIGLRLINTNPARDLPSDIFKSPKKKNYATVTDPKDIAVLLNKLSKFSGSYQVEKALELAPYIFLRPGELVGLKWDEVDFNDKIIRIDGGRMKMKKSHLVPMSNQVFSLLHNMKEQVDFGSDFIFPSPRNNKEHITTASLLSAIRGQGIDKNTFTTHSFRSMASTRLNEMGIRSDAIEVQLAHKDSNKIRGTYNHAQYLDERKDMMQIWSDYINSLKR